MRKRHRFNRRMTRIVLLISFIFFFGRFVYSSIGAWYHHQDKKQSQQSTITVEPSDPLKTPVQNKRGTPFSNRPERANAALQRCLC